MKNNILPTRIHPLINNAPFFITIYTSGSFLRKPFSLPPLFPGDIDEAGHRKSRGIFLGGALTIPCTTLHLPGTTTGVFK